MFLVEGENKFGFSDDFTLGGKTPRLWGRGNQRSLSRLNRKTEKRRKKKGELGPNSCR